MNAKLANFIPGMGIVTPQSAGWNGLYQPDRNNLGPRIGFAYILPALARPSFEVASLCYTRH